MGSRVFSTTARQLKQLQWSLNGTTVDVHWAMKQIERSVDESPTLHARVASAQVNGNPHPTPNRDDPYHVTVVLLDADGKRITSAHAYVNGFVIFSKTKLYKPVKIAPVEGAPVYPPEGVVTSKSDSAPASGQAKK